MLTSADFVVIALYAVLMTWIGIQAKRRATGVDAYFAAGHSLPWWMAAISHHVSGYSAVVFVGFAGRAASAGFSIWTLFSVSTFIAMMTACILWAPRWSRLKVLTPVEYLEQRYSNAVRALVAICGIGVKFIDLGIKLYAISIVVQVVTGWPLLPIITIGGLITIAYVLIGGLWATVLTDVAQFFIQFVLSAIVVVIVLGEMGGWSGMWSQLPPERYALFNASAGIGFDFWFVLMLITVLSYSGATWGLAQRFIAVEKPREAQKAAMFSGILYLFYPLVILIPAWAAPLMLPEHFDPATLLPLASFDPQQTYVLMAQKVLEGLAPGLIGLLICSMFAATMSMIDSDINSLAAVFTKDIYQRNFGQDTSDAKLFRVGMYATVTFGLAVLAASIWVSQSEGTEKVFKKTIELFSALLPPVGIPLMFGMVWKRTTARGAILSLVGGFLTFALLKFLYPDQFVIYTGGEVLASLLIFFGEGFIGKRSAEKEQEVEELFSRLEP